MPAYVERGAAWHVRHSGREGAVAEGERERFCVTNGRAFAPPSNGLALVRMSCSQIRIRPATRQRQGDAEPCHASRHGPDQAYGKQVAVKGIDLTVERGRIVGLIGPNGAGKTTALKAMLGLTPFQGNLKVLGRDPWSERDLLMQDVCFIADVAVLPRWLKVSQALDFVAGCTRSLIAPRRSAFARTVIKRGSKVGALSKGMVAQLHLALVMAIEAKLLVLDEPTLGLDILFASSFTTR